MGENCNWPCWKIMNCEASKDCPAKSHPETPCWEIVKKLMDYRYAMGICSDCIVYMLKSDDSILTKQEMKTIMTHRTNNCVLA